MELWACGFNAWNQLHFDGEHPLEPHDLNEFKCILSDARIEILLTTTSSILVRISSGIRLAGSPDSFTLFCLDKKDCLAHIAVAGNEKVVDFDISRTLSQYKSLQAYSEKAGQELGYFEGIKQIVANQTSFAALSSDCKVWTWGDERYTSCLGREVTDTSPATEPGVVEDLQDLPTGPIKQIASGGYVTAAVTAGNDLYVWGGRPGQPEILAQLTGSPAPVDIQGHDILAVGVGENHMIAMTTDHKIFVVGIGGNGQLGMVMDQLEDWKEVSPPLKNGQQIVDIHAGYKNSFVLVQNLI